MCIACLCHRIRNEEIARKISQLKCPLSGGLTTAGKETFSNNDRKRSIYRPLTRWTNDLKSRYQLDSKRVGVDVVAKIRESLCPPVSPKIFDGRMDDLTKNIVELPYYSMWS